MFSFTLKEVFQNPVCGCKNLCEVKEKKYADNVQSAGLHKVVLKDERPTPIASGAAEGD